MNYLIQHYSFFMECFANGILYFAAAILGVAMFYCRPVSKARVWDYAFQALMGVMLALCIVLAIAMSFFIHTYYFS